MANYIVEALGENKEVLESIAVRSEAIPRVGETIVIDPYNGPPIQDFERICEENRTLGAVEFEKESKERLEARIRFHTKYAGLHEIVDVLNPMGVYFKRRSGGEDFRDTDYRLAWNNINIYVFTASTMPRVRFLPFGSTL